MSYLFNKVEQSFKIPVCPSHVPFGIQSTAPSRSAEEESTIKGFEQKREQSIKVQDKEELDKKKHLNNSFCKIKIEKKMKEFTLFGYISS